MSYSAVGLYGPKNGINIGGAMRAASCYGASLVAIQATRAVKIRQPADTHHTYSHTPVVICSDLFDVLPFDCVPIAVEFLDYAQDIREFKHPKRAMYIFGPEDGTLERKVLSKCRDIIQIPTVLCMNLAATVNVVLYDRMLKEKT